MTNVKRRSRLQMQIAVLEACDWRDGLPLTRIAQKAFINVQDCKQILELLVRKNYIQRTTQGKRFLFKLTNLGRNFGFEVAKMLENLDCM